MFYCMFYFTCDHCFNLSSDKYPYVAVELQHIDQWLHATVPTLHVLRPLGLSIYSHSKFFSEGRGGFGWGLAVLFNQCSMMLRKCVVYAHLASEGFVPDGQTQPGLCPWIPLEDYRAPDSRAHSALTLATPPYLIIAPPLPR